MEELLSKKWMFSGYLLGIYSEELWMFFFLGYRMANPCVGRLIILTIGMNYIVANSLVTNKHG